MVSLDFKPVDLENGERLLPLVPIGVRIASDKEIDHSETSVESESKYRKAFKTTEVVVIPAKYNEVDHELECREISLPSQMIKHEEKSVKEIDEIVEYDLDEEDFVYLEDENKKREVKKKKKIKDEMFELAIDRLEKETYFKSASHESHSEEVEHLDDDCCICQNGDVENTNQIIYCDMCNIPVHQDCYGVPYIPEGQWLCRKCKLSPMESVKCELCPLKDGAFKQTSDGKWAHVACAIWLNEVHFGNTAFLEPIEGVAESLRRRQKLRCLVCKVKGGGCLQCSKGSCVKSFHVTCAMQARLQMVTDTVEDKKDPDGVSVKRFVYCHVHGSVAVGENEFAKNKKRAIEAIHRARRQMQSDAHHSSSAPLPTVDDEARKRIEGLVGKDMVEEIMGFWFYKRKKRCGLPLIRRLQVKKVKVARVQSVRGEVIHKGRIVYEKVRLLLEMMKKREKYHADKISIEKKFMRNLLTPTDILLAQFITSLKPIDELAFFKEDPMKQGLKDYSSIVKKPMDLTTMKSNAENGLYKNEGEMKEHLDLIFNNCILYNKANEGVIEYAKRVQEIMNKEYDGFVQYLKYTRTWMDDLSRTGDPKKREVKKELKEVKEENADELMEMRDTHTHREESNRRKRKGDTPKVEEHEVKRERRTRDGDKEHVEMETRRRNTPAVISSIFAPSSLSSIPKNSELRRLSLDAIGPRLDSNSNKSHPHRRLTRGTTQPSFSNYRDISVLSPEMGATSCDSAVESDIDMGVDGRPDSRSVNRASLSSLSDPNSLQHGDLVEVNGKAARVVSVSMEMLEHPRWKKQVSKLTPGPDEVVVKTFAAREPSYARYERSCVTPLDPMRTTNDQVEGIREAREYHNRIIYSK